MPEELKPCRLCGGKAKENGLDYGATVVCLSCGFIEDWNVWGISVGEDALRARLEAAEKLISLLDARDAVEVQPELFASEKEYRHALRQAAERVQAARIKLEAVCKVERATDG